MKMKLISRRDSAAGFTRVFKKTHLWLAAVSAAVLLVAAGTVARRIVSERTPPAPPAVRRVAVLPFVDLSPDRNYEHFGEGISDILINALNRVEGFRTPARTSAFYFKGKNVTLREIGRKLGVEAILDGSIQVQGEQIRIVASLLDVADGFQIWSERYDRPADDIFAVEVGPEGSAKPGKLSLRGLTPPSVLRPVRHRILASLLRRGDIAETELGAGEIGDRILLPERADLPAEVIQNEELNPVRGRFKQ
jgi:TolB-like protein